MITYCTVEVIIQVRTCRATTKVTGTEIKGNSKWNFPMSQMTDNEVKLLSHTKEG